MIGAEVKIRVSNQLFTVGKTIPDTVLEEVRGLHLFCSADSVSGVVLEKSTSTLET